MATRQRLEILRLLYRGADVLILDEPTAVLAPPQVAELMRLLRALRDGGRTIVFICTSSARCSSWPTRSPCCAAAG